MKTVLISLFVVFATLQVNAQSKKVKTEAIKTSIQCEMCIDRLTDTFAENWAIRNVDFDLENQMVSVKYNSKQIDLDGIEQLISDSGYDANHKEANQEIYGGLPPCCKKKKSSCSASKGKNAKKCAATCKKSAKEKKCNSTCKDSAKEKKCSSTCKDSGKEKKCNSKKEKKSCSKKETCKGKKH